MFPAVETFLEFWHVQSKSFGILNQVLGIQGFLILKEFVMHLPEFTLVSGTGTCFGSLESLLVEPERKVEEIISDFTRINVIFDNLRDRLTDVSRTERSLVVRKLNDREFGILAALEGISVDIDDGLLELLRGGSCLELTFNPLEFFLDCLLPFL